MSDTKKEEWKAAMEAKGHTPIMMQYPGGEPELDIWVVEQGYHNGPGCSTCGWSTCQHCNRLMIIPECREVA
jgi:hypothetical protein